MTLEPCPACDNPRCYGRCLDNQRAIRTLDRLRKEVAGLENDSIVWPAIFGLAERPYFFKVNVKEVLDESTVGVLFSPTAPVRYLKKRERVGAVVPDHYVEDEHE